MSDYGCGLCGASEPPHAPDCPRKVVGVALDDSKDGSVRVALRRDDTTQIPLWPALVMTHSRWGIRFDTMREGRHLSLTFPDAMALGEVWRQFETYATTKP